MPDFTKMQMATKVIHAGQVLDPGTGAIVPPIFTSATYAQSSPGSHKGFEYTRSHNPTRFAIENMVAILEGSTLALEDDPTRGGFAFASGLAATATILELLDRGARLVAMDDLYGGTRRLLSQVRERSQGLDVHYADLSSLDELAAAMTPDTKMIWVETPTNPLLKIADLEGVARIAKAVNPDVLLVCDNTFATPVGQRPMESGFDVVMHSTTKYLNGHSDVVGGLVVVGRKDLARRMRFLQNAVGAVMGPFDAYQTLRGVKTLSLRMERHSASGQKVAEFLESHPMVERVLYPGLASHPQHALYKRQMNCTGGMITFFVKGGLEAARLFLETLEIVHLAESLGAVESLINHPAIMTHASVPAETREQLGISDSLVRMSVGVEDVKDIIGDLDRALEAAEKRDLVSAVT